MSQPKPSMMGTTHVLPFERLSAEDFERLCLELVQHEGYERAEHLGAAGGEQGRDIVAWRGDQQWAFQCKRVQRFGPQSALREVDKVLDLPEAERPDGLFFLVTCNVSDRTRRAVRAHCGNTMDSRFLAHTELDARVWRYPGLVRKFFGAEILETSPDLDAIRAGYLESLRDRHVYLDLGAIAPRVQNRTVKLAMRDIYVPVEAEKELSM